MSYGQEKISRPFEYKGYSKKEYKSYVRKSEYVTMSDGVKLAVDIYLPSKGPERKSFPTVVEYTPYSRAFISAAFKPLEKTNAKNMMGGYGALIPMPFCFDMSLIENGYALVIADLRGAGASFGSRLDLGPQIGKDGAELIDWIAKQEWSDGNVGMKGGSYMAMSQIMTASNRPKSLKAIFLMVYPFGFQDIYVGGIYSVGFMLPFSEMLWTMNMNQTKTVGSFPIMPSAPVVDEDGDGELLDELPIDINKNGTFLDDYKYPEDPNDEPRYEDGAKRKHIYYLATKDHEKNLKINDWISKAGFIDFNLSEIGLDKQYGNLDGYDISPAGMMPPIMESGIPIYHLGGWFDAQPRSTTIFYSTAKKTNPSKLLMLPVYHILTSPFYKYFGEDGSKVTKNVSTETLRFFDKYLKGIDNGIDKEPPVTLYVMGRGIRQESNWPPEGWKPINFYFGENNKLINEPDKPGKDKYKADFTHNSGFGPQSGNRWKMYMIPSDVPDRAEMDKKCLVYDSAPMNQDTEVTGHPIADIWVSSTADYGDIYVYISDVTEDGKAILVTEQPIRAGFAGLEDINTMVKRGKTGIDVLPKLPWHGYEKADYQDKIFTGGRIVELKFDLMPTSWVFKKGHKIRVAVAAADWPTFPLHPKLSPSNDPKDGKNIVPELTFYRDKEHQSMITMPVVPNK